MRAPLSTETPVRVLMVLEAAYPAQRGGGAEAQVRTLSRALRARGHRVTVLAPQLRDGLQGRVCRVDGVPVVRLRYPHIRLFSGPLLWLTLAAFLVRRRHRYDAWHVHIAHRMGAVCALLGSWLDKRVLAKVSGWWELEMGTLAPNAPFWDRIAYKALLRIGTWQVISQRIAKTLAARGIPAERIAAIPNAVDTQRFAGVTRAPDAPARFVFIGRLEKEKGLDTLLDAFSDIAPAHPQASLLVVGTGSLEEGLKARAQALGIATQVDFAGHRNDIERVLADANLGVLPSRIEGLSNTLLESMASGLPMVASRISGNEDFVRAETGWLFEPGDRAGLAQALAQAAALPAHARQAMGEAARVAVERQAGLERVLARLLAIYRGQPAPVQERSALAGTGI
ncbi:glycosyltransferase family 4 protein [Pseudoxanthomonas composti]|uniref:Glycosyltransferase family 1 protein n=1 Tax=Pseudoxanthomonas composti TaxID=2137479 RepID=A0A4Q1JRR0_9GAMM|nr:glycosyltransferase family 4 protein [Pseudoxanthomonas composti]RXR00885.1 glycosyltransferase family 1 protein [Pseudoxanthomonas composti]